jgi:hypothetical protein
LSASVEAGRYLDTVGFVSFPNKETVETVDRETATSLFRHVFLDANVESLKEALSTEELTTPFGKEVSSFIQNTRQSLGLEMKLGCAPQDYFLNRSLEADDSLWRLYREQVVPTQLQQESPTNRASLLSQGSWRYDLFGGGIVVYDDMVAVSPFDEPVYFVGKFSGSTVLLLNKTMNKDATPFYNTLPAFILSGTVDPNQDCELYCHHFELENITEALLKINSDMAFSPVTTNLTSTNIWTSFVLDQWPCPGDEGLGNPWFANHPKQSTGDEDQRNILVVGLTVAGALTFLIGGLFTCFILMKILCCDPNDYDDDYEMDAFNEEEEDGEEILGEFA